MHDGQKCAINSADSNPSKLRGGHVRLSIDTDSRIVRITKETGSSEIDLYSAESFALLSNLWSKLAWNAKYTYGFAWMGRPIIQFPEDMIRIQETIYRLKPDVVIETGVAHGGSLVFYASLLRAMGKGRVIGIDIEIRPHNRAAIEAHELADAITLVEGSSTDTAIVERVRALVKPREKVLVLLDSNHTKAHVAAELELYSLLVTPGSYIVATDAVMEQVHDTPRGKPEWLRDNPGAAVREFIEKHSEFELEDPPFIFNETATSLILTHWPSAYLRRRS
jgi:cephalosporin hydroxylase